ncbi:PhnD/SsuA/transferrin family substrate-binding protein [Lutimaribacter sp. EGI FJ00014]|uniref:PhnD/SsuA/transferrin family substrate-binding protein n=1 Tax=Lutimaribacter degradans TaxID=2945989 RepID=A0ACC5ZV49_9RHOB|nr:PhnD/SsuA/transferrin family substrate-binding protein [Lutimaribacter sp. EGI FJ00013]MCM2561429.1 PhnD/SsuA/transferrin family substrate-binding protein [Lutimaribacter sp. EGI FJ00013]MCO0635519.1 PhnD/SsuA/transferrin family substrate-binding protein [Lutimaribacter sp. EGI FJ00014]
MYDLPWLRGPTDRLWHAVRAHLPDAMRDAAPAAPTRDADPWDIWQSPDLLLAQTCGLPFRARLHERVALVASPDHRLHDCALGQYRSTLIRRRDDTRRLEQLAQGIMAYNEPLSQSGWAAPMAHLAARGLAPGCLLQTGAHLASVDAVAEGRADFAAIDAVTLALFAAHDPDTMARLDPFDHTTPTPALPYITAARHDPAPIATALAAGIAAISADDRAALYLHGVTRLPPSAYTAMPIPDAPDQAANPSS